MKHETEYAEASNKEGFTKLPHYTLDALISNGLNKRELALALLIVRLTTGCNRDWGLLRQADLVVIGVKAQHAKEVLTDALRKGILVQNGKSKEYKLGDFHKGVDKSATQKLSHLVGKQLHSKTSQNGNDKLPKMGSSKLPNKEVGASQNGNSDGFPKRELSRLETPDIQRPKDSDKDKPINTDINSPVANKKVIDPAQFNPKNNTEAAALEVWQALEPHQPRSFGLYLHFVKLGLPTDMFYRFLSEIRQDPSIRNPGAVFNKKAMEHCRSLLAAKVGANG